jgi:glycopeptide antibiotics resistance protein
MLLITTFAVYIAVVADLTVVPTHLARVRDVHSDHISLRPFNYSFRCYRNAFGSYRSLRWFCLRNTVGNIVLFLPLGTMLPLISERLRTLKRVLLIAFLLSLSIETTQYVLRFVGSPRAVDIDDVILNTLGGCLGFAFYTAFIARYVRSGLAED